MQRRFDKTAAKWALQSSAKQHYSLRMAAMLQWQYSCSEIFVMA